VLGSGGKLLMGFTKLIHDFCKDHADNGAKEFVEPLAHYNKEWGELTMKIGEAAMQNPDEAGAAAVDYLMYSGYVTLAYFWAQIAVVAQEKLAAGTDEADFYKAKVFTAQFYFERLLPRAVSLKETMLSGSHNLMELDEALFDF
jgi:hypothetical protein